MAKNVFSGLVTAWRLAGWPTSCSPSLLKATIDGRGARPFRILDDLRLFAFHDGDAGIGRAEVDTNNFSHLQNLLAADPGGSPISGTSAPDFRGCGSPI